MKHVVLITIIVILALYGCTTVNFVKTGSMTYPPYNGDVKILDVPLEGVNYEVIGIVSVDRPWGTQYDHLIKLMQKVAAQNGANAIILCGNKDFLQTGNRDSTSVAPAIKILPKAEKVVPPAFTQAPTPTPIEKVVPPAFVQALAPTPIKKEKAIVEKGRATLNIQFDTNKAVVKDQYNAELVELADIMRKYPDLRVMIEGHTDNVGNDDLNMMLSQKRADSVKNYLVTKFGIDASHLDAKGYGETRPIVDNNTKEGRQKNRRVEAAVEYEKTVK